MFFGNKNKIKCSSCSSKIQKSHSYCPYCGYPQLSQEQIQRDYGFLGTADSKEIPQQPQGFTDKIIGSLVNSLMKNLDKQFREMQSSPEVTSMPNGIKIKLSTGEPAKQIRVKKTISESQLKKMSSLPRAQAKSSVKRFSDRVVYELATKGVLSPEDIIISKLETGYEIKAIGSSKVYVNSLPINLPLRSISIKEDKVLVEFKNQ